MIKFNEIGPEKLIEIYNPEIKLHGFLVIDSTKLGPAKGGLRITPTVTLEEIYHLARIMTYKCAISELPFGGGKAGIRVEIKGNDKSNKLLLIREFAKAIKNLCPSEYITAPDIGTGETEMAEFVKTIGSPKAATGKPVTMGGIPHELGTTGYGVALATQAATNFLKINLVGSKVVIIGFGNVGSFTALFLEKMGAKIIAVSDSKGAVYNSDGLNVEKLVKIKNKNGSVTNYNEAKQLTKDEILKLKTDILIPASLGNTINTQNFHTIDTKIIVEAANLPTSKEAESELHKMGITIIPDFIANAGGVISSYAEYVGYSQQKAFELIKEKVIRNTTLILEMATKEKISTREAGLIIAKQRLTKSS